MFKRLLQSILILLAPMMAFASSLPSNLIVFGDSLSDIGNFPQSQFVRIFPENQLNNPDPAKAVDAGHIYVPITNPVNRQGARSYQLYIPGQQSVQLNYPQLSSSQYTLPKNDAIDTLISANNPITPQHQRDTRAIGWVEYLFENLYHGQGNYHLLPSNMLSTIIATPQTSVVYAYSSALSEDNCRDSQYERPQDCSLQTVKDSAAAYRSIQTPQINHLESNLRVPGLVRQVKFFLADPQFKQLASAHTQYLFLIGGNDISYGYYHFLPHHELKYLPYLFGKVTHDNVVKAVKLLLAQGIQPQQIHLISLFNGAFTPQIYNQGKVRMLGTIVTNLYNISIHLFALRQHLDFIDQYGLVEKLSKYPSLKATLGQPCQAANASIDGLLASGQTPGMIGAFASGQSAEDCGNYLFWNQLHPTSLVEQQLAYLTYTALNNSSKHEETSVVSLLQQSQHELLAARKLLAALPDTH